MPPGVGIPHPVLVALFVLVLSKIGTWSPERHRSGKRPEKDLEAERAIEEDPKALMG
jgi:hypothetical protein